MPEKKNQILNIFNPDPEIFGLILQMLCQGFQYKQFSEILNEKNVYVPEDQFEALLKVVDIQLDLDIGCRQGEDYGTDSIRTRASLKVVAEDGTTKEPTTR